MRKSGLTIRHKVAEMSNYDYVQERVWLEDLLHVEPVAACLILDRYYPPMISELIRIQRRARDLLLKIRYYNFNLLHEDEVELDALIDDLLNS